MSSMYNSIHSYSNIGDRKYNSGRVALEVGDKFSGRISKVNKESNEVLIKFLDGTEIFATLDGELSDEALKALSKFEVIQWDNGKLKLKILEKKEVKQEIVNNENYNIENNEELEDGNVISKLFKYNIPINKENIVKVNSVLDFLSKLQLNEAEGEKFVKNILNAKGINETSPKGTEIKNLLNDFLASFKMMSEEEVLTFIENNIEFTKENIESYKKIFNEKDGLSNLFENIDNDILALNKEPKESKEKLEIRLVEKESDTNIDKKSIYNEEKYEKGITVKDNINENSNNKNIKNENGENKLIEGYNNTDIIENNDKHNSEKIMSILNKIGNEEAVDSLSKKILFEVQEKDIVEQIKNNIEDIDVKEFKNDKELINKVISKVIGKEVSFTNKELENIIKNLKNTHNIDLLEENINNKEGINKKNSETIKSDLKNHVTKQELPKIEITTKEIIKEQIKENTNSVKDIIKDIISNVKDAEEGNVPTRIMEVISKNMDSFKLFNNISENYYYMDMPLNLQDSDYQCKLVIKDDRSKGKKIDSKNVKMIVSVATVNIGNIDSYLAINDKSIQVDIKCNKEYVKMLEGGSRVLEEKILDIGLVPKITVKEKIEEVSLSNCNKFFNDATISALDIKV